MNMLTNLYFIDWLCNHLHYPKDNVLVIECKEVKISAGILTIHQQSYSVEDKQLLRAFQDLIDHKQDHKYLFL
jgi:peptidoglycan/xylan/chitin deacetylase (PgdA/CDA1 family)